MKRFLIAAGLSAALLTNLSAQQQPTVWAASTYYHVADNSRAAFEAAVKDKSRKLFTAALKEDPNLLAMSLMATQYGGVPEPPANYILTIFSSNIPANRQAVFEAASQKAFGKPYSEYTKEMGALRERIGQTLSRQLTGTPRDVAEGDYVRIDRMKITPGRAGDYTQMEQQYKRLREAQVAEGKLKSWSAWMLVLPGGSEREYDAYTAQIGKDLQTVLTWGQGQSAIAAKLTPPFELTGLAMRADSIRKLVRSDVRRVVVVVQK